MITEPTLTRRSFVKIGGGLVVTLAALPDTFTPNGASAEAATLDATKLNSWLEIRSDGRIVARTGRTEMGVGMAAYFRQTVAEELYVRPETIDLVMGDTDRTPDGGWSASFLEGAQNLRKVSAYTYQALLGLAADRLGAPAVQLTVENGVVRGGGKSVSYVDLLKGQQFELTIPVAGTLAAMNAKGTGIIGTAGMTVTGNPALKPVSKYTVVGTSFASPSVEEKVTGKTQWVGDLRLPGMLHARMVRPSTLGSTLVTVGTFDKKKFPTAEVVTKGNLVAVVSPDEWEAVSASRAVAATTKWSDWAGLPGHANLGEVIKANRVQGAKRGDADKTAAALKSSAKVVPATYEQPYVKHAPIGPFVAVADVKADGTTTVWSHGAQSQGMRAHLSHMLSLPIEKVTVRWLEGAGQYGRTSLGGDAADADAAILSQLLGKPVRVQWTLQEDFAWSTGSSAWVSDLKAGLDAQGKLTALESDFIMAPGMDYRMVGAMLAGMPELPVPAIGGGPAAFGFGAVTQPYVIPNEFHQGAGARVELMKPPSGVGLRGNIMRTPGQRQHVCALESILNEAAAAAGADPVQFRIDHTKDQRLIDIIRKTATEAGWSPRPSPNPAARRTGDTPVAGRGMAVMYRFGAYWAGIADIEVVPSTGVITVKKFTIGVDPGKVINPRHLKSNCEGGVVMGMGEVLMEQLTFDQGKVTSIDWTKYKIPTMKDLPEIKVVTIDRDDAGFGGVGEAANSLPQPAILAAVFDATGVQPRRTPLTPDYVRSLLQKA
ncbi:MAG: molybdopterin cofactor-binding domain-containing protein [Vicinamibacterales bacterium]